MWGKCIVNLYEPLLNVINVGMSLDAIVAMDVVLANGTIVEASAEKNPDVFWVNIHTL